jgi:hypothetical protein
VCISTYRDTHTDGYNAVKSLCGGTCVMLFNVMLCSNMELVLSNEPNVQACVYIHTAAWNCLISDFVLFYLNLKYL